MSEFYAQLVRINKIEKHPNADTLSIYTVLNDYPVIDKTDKFQLNELVAYIPESAIVPDNELFYFLCPFVYIKYTENGEIKHKASGKSYKIGSVPERHRTIKSKKIRDIYSQGLLLKLPEELSDKEEGYSIVDFYSLSRVEEDNEENIIKLKVKGRNAESPPKGWAPPYYDIEGLRKYNYCILPDEEIVLNEKLNGSNSFYLHDGDRLWVKSRNFFKKESNECPWWIIAKNNNLESKLSKYPMYGFFGELINLVKGFNYTNIYPDIIFFDIIDIKSKRFLDYDQFLNICNDLQLKTSPELYRGTYLDKDVMYNFAEGHSTLNEKVVREGFVLKTTKERFDPNLRGRLQLKLVGKGYNLKK